jgi:hypothetical protein
LKYLGIIANLIENELLIKKQTGTAMKKARFILGLFLCIMVTDLVAQTIEMDWGSLNELKKNTWFQKIIGGDGDGFYLLRSEGIQGINTEKIWLDYFSSTPIQLESTNEMAMPTVSGMISKYNDMYYVDTKFILFSTIDNAASAKTSLYIQYMNNNGTIKNKPKEIANVPIANLPEDGFKVKYLDKEKKFLVLCHPTITEYNNEPITIKVVDLSLQETFGENLTFPLKGKSFEIVQVEMGSKGDLYFMIKSTVADPKAKKAPGGTTGGTGTTKAEKYEYSLLIYTLATKEYKSFPITTDKFAISSAIMGINKEEDIVVTGLVCGKTTKIAGEFSGAFCQKFNPKTLKAYPTDPKSSVRVFPKEFIATFDQERNGETQDLRYKFSLKNLFVLENGGFIVLAEQYYDSYKTMIEPGTKVETRIYYYHYNDILAFGGDKDGKLNWNILIPKNQLSNDDLGYYHSYAAAAEGNKIKVMFNDNNSNTDVKDPTRIKELKNNPNVSPKGLAIVATIYADGSFEKDPMFKNDDSKTVLCPRLFSNFSGRYMIYGQERSYFKFGSFVFE